MRRSRSALTAWPAFADLMTVLAVLGLAIAAGVASVAAPDPPDPGVSPGGQERLQDQLQETRDQLQEARELSARLEAQLAEARARNRELELRVTEDVLGSVPCLGTRPDSLTAPVPLLRIVVDSGYALTRLWPPEKEAEVADIPRLDEAIANGLMQEGDLQDYARDIHAYGNAEDTYAGPCRFWVELGKGETTSQTAFARALGVVNQYFLLTNSSEVNRILRATR